MDEPAGDYSSLGPACPTCEHPWAVHTLPACRWCHCPERRELGASFSIEIPMEVSRADRVTLAWGGNLI